ncbi:4-hydroxy-tetrahydrodipicolinate synthase [Candidatus Poribacteria bacterium]|jgi:4-hydroxy-tetrahydrodipicolinate synthase|nr:4-hydroxy-tetrahydrodipicolinate synthase [Candidatus Poribacteria bacterium]
MFEGSFVAIVTPFNDDGSLDDGKLKELIEFQIENGTHGIVPCGTTGESPTLTHDEHDRVVELTVETVDGRVQVIAGAGSNSTAEALRLTRHAKAVGADGALVITPYYNKPTQNGLYAHFMHITDRVDIPVVIYNVPGRTGTDLQTATLAKLATHQNIIGLKEATGQLSRASEAVNACNDEFTVLSGDDINTLPIMAVGGRGVISVLANVAPREVADMCNAFKTGDLQTAQQIHHQTMQLALDLFIDTNPIPVKTALQMMGKLNGRMRLPLAPMSDDTLEVLRQTMKNTGLL